MALDETSRAAMNRIDVLLRSSSDFMPLNERSKYLTWYALLLGALATIAGDDDVVFACSSYDEPADSAELIIYTSRLLTVVKAGDVSEDDATCEVRTVARRSLTAMSLSVSERHDTDHVERIVRTWPGMITFTLEYATLPAPLTFTASAAPPVRSDQPSDTVRLLDGLRSDLADREA